MVIINKNPLDAFINYFYQLNPYEMSILGNILGIVLALPLNLNQQNTLGNFLELVGQQILLIQAQGSTLSPNPITTKDINEILQKINFKFEYIEDLFTYLKNLAENSK